jgi:hypothetical protein
MRSCGRLSPERKRKSFKTTSASFVGHVIAAGIAVAGDLTIGGTAPAWAARAASNANIEHLIL